MKRLGVTDLVCFFKQGGRQRFQLDLNALLLLLYSASLFPFPSQINHQFRSIVLELFAIDQDAIRDHSFMLLNLSLQLPHPVLSGIKIMTSVAEGIVKCRLMIYGGYQLVAQSRDLVGKVWVVGR